ncbi:MAG TPA: hypothetical protein VF725_04390, partial [Ktedonobacterales bacterium]
MHRPAWLRAVDQAGRTVLDESPRPEQTAVAGLVCGVGCAEQTQVSRASAAIPGVAQDRSKLRRAQWRLATPRLEVARAQRRLLRQGRAIPLLWRGARREVTATGADLLTTPAACGGSDGADDWARGRAARRLGVSIAPISQTHHTTLTVPSHLPACASGCDLGHTARVLGAATLSPTIL